MARSQMYSVLCPFELTGGARGKAIGHIPANTENDTMYLCSRVEIYPNTN